MSLYPPFTTKEELGRRIPGGIGDGDDDRALALLEDAATLIRNEAGRPSWYAEEGSDDGEWVLTDDVPDLLVTVSIRLASRCLVNPFGAKTTGIDTFQVTWGDDDGYWRAEIQRLAGTAGGLSSLKVRSPMPIGPTIDSVSEDTWDDWDPDAVPRVG